MKHKTVLDAVHRVLKANLEKLKRSGDIVRKGFNVSRKNTEAIHDMRVGVRRLRASLKTLNKVLPAEAKKIRDKLRKLGRALGQKRDLDIFLEFVLPSIDADSIAFNKLVRKSERMQKRIQTMLKSEFYTQLIESLEQLEPKKTKHNVLQMLLNHIRKALDAVIKIGTAIGQADDKKLHQLRIAIKKLRYTCELDPSWSIGSFTEKTRKMQDILGEHQDTIAGISMLTTYKNMFSLKEFSQIKRKYELKKSAMRKLFFKAWKDYWAALLKVN